MEVREKSSIFAANADVLEMNVAGLASLALSLRGTFTATIQFEGTIDGKTWFAISCTPIVSGSAVTSATAVGQWTANVAGLLSVRMRVSAFTSGSPEAILRAVPSGGGSGSSSGGGAATIADGADVALGATTDAAVSTDTTGTISGKIRGVVKILASVWNSTIGKLLVLDALTPTTYTIVVANGGTNQSANITQVGKTTELIVSAPSINGSGATFQLDILNANGKAIFSQASYAENTDHRILIHRNLIATDTIKITTSVTVGADKTFTVEVR